MRKSSDNCYGEVNSYVNDAKYHQRRYPHSRPTYAPIRLPEEQKSQIYTEPYVQKPHDGPVKECDEYRKVAKLLKSVEERRKSTGPKNFQKPRPHTLPKNCREDEIQQDILYPYIVRARSSNTSMPNCYLMEDSLKNDYEIPKLPYYVVPVLYIPQKVVPNAEFSSETLKQCKQKYAKYVNNSAQKYDKMFESQFEKKQSIDGSTQSDDNGLLIKVYQEEVKKENAPKSNVISVSMQCQTEDICADTESPLESKSTQTLFMNTNNETQTDPEKKKTVTFSNRNCCKIIDNDEAIPKCNKEFERCSFNSCQQDSSPDSSVSSVAVRIQKRRNVESIKLPSWKY